MKDLKISSKIMGLVGVLLLMMVVSSGYGLQKIGHVGEELHTIAAQNIPMTETIVGITVNQLEQAIWLERALRDSSEIEESDSAAQKFKHDIAEYDVHTENVNKLIKVALELIHQSIDGVESDDLLAKFKQMEEQLHVIEKHHKSYEDHSHQIFAMLKKGEHEGTEHLAEIVEKEEEQLDKELNQYLLNIEEFTHKSALKAEEDEKAAFWGIIIITCATLGVGFVLGFFLTRVITAPINKGVEFAKLMANGDLNQKLDVKNKDEMGQLAASLNHMGTSLQEMFRKTADGINTLSSSSTELSAISEQMASGAEQTSGRAGQVATAAEEMSSNMDSVAAASEQASTNVQMVASASEQMSATINEIAGNTEKARSITSNAVNHAQSVSKRVSELGQSANDVGKVTEAINDISEQTNLLALNATIEAARAGEAGKGFAVVANEIKELAKQTAESTQDIRNKIEGIQSTTSGTVNDIAEIERIIASIDEIVGTIATAIEEQSAATAEITSNVNQAAQGIQDVNENVAQSSVVSSSIAEEVAGVNQASSEMEDGSTQVKASAAELSKLSEELKAMIQQYRI